MLPARCSPLSCAQPCLVGHIPRRGEVLLLETLWSQLAWGRSWRRKRPRRSMPDNALPEPIQSQRAATQGWKTFLRDHAAGIASIDLQ
jgi:hypothetical protein